MSPRGVASRILLRIASYHQGSIAYSCPPSLQSWGSSASIVRSIVNVASSNHALRVTRDHDPEESPTNTEPQCGVHRRHLASQATPSKASLRQPVSPCPMRHAAMCLVSSVMNGASGIISPTAPSAGCIPTIAPEAQGGGAQAGLADPCLDQPQAEQCMAGARPGGCGSLRGHGHLWTLEGDTGPRFLHN